ncbi:MAG: TIGR02466 family protein [Yoonia sp.]
MAEFEELSPLMMEWKDHLDLMRDTENEGKGRSTRAGWSGPKTLFNDPIFFPLREKCQTVFAQALKQMSLPDGFRFGIEAWGNIHESGGFNQPHIHREAILSGCFYLYTPEGSGAIVFHDPRPGTLYSRPWGRGVNSWSKSSIAVRAGTLLLFPQWLEHSVEPNAATEHRYSIAMNAILPSSIPSVSDRGS